MPLANHTWMPWYLSVGEGGFGTFGDKEHFSWPLILGKTPTINILSSSDRFTEIAGTLIQSGRRISLLGFPSVARYRFWKLLTSSNIFQQQLPTATSTTAPISEKCYFSSHGPKPVTTFQSSSLGCLLHYFYGFSCI